MLPHLAIARKGGCILLLLLGAAACLPRAPLDRKVDAETVGAYERWLDRELPQLLPEREKELRQALNVIAARTPRDSGVVGDSFLRRLDGLTIRDVLVLGREATNDALAHQIEQESENILRLLQREESAPNGTNVSNGQRIEHKRKSIEALKARIEANRAQIRQLETEGR